MARKTYKKVIVTDELLDKVNPENIKLVDSFLKDKSTRTSNTTIRNYRSDANIFFVWNLENNDNKFFVDIKKLEFSNFFSFAVDELRWGSSRASRMRSFLSSLSTFIEKFMDDEYPEFRNIILKTIESIPKEPRREKTILSEEQVNKLLDYLKRTDSQKAFWFALAVYSGSRFAELLRFTTDILDENNTAFGDLFMETIKPIRTKGRGREGKMLHKYILKDNFLPYYKQWIADRQVIMDKHNRVHNKLFIKKDGSPATSGTIRSWVTSMETYLGVDLYPHCLRHYLCTELSRKKIPRDFIQFLFGWSSSEMYNIYNDLTIKDTDWKELEILRDN